MSLDNITLDLISHSILRNVELVGRGIVVDNKNKIYLDFTLKNIEYYTKLKSSVVVYFRKLFPSKTIENAIVLSNFLDKNYFHWTFESLGRMITIENIDITSFKVIVSEKPPKFIHESLNYVFGIPYENLIYVKKTSRLFLKNVYFSSFPFTNNNHTLFYNVYNPSVLKKINRIKKINNFELSSADKKVNIIIDRKSSDTRKILNVFYLLESLNEYNFILVNLEDLKFSEQVSLFSKANIIIGVHGAGLSNIIYSNSSVLIELFPRNRNARDLFYFYQISKAIEIDHHVIYFDSKTKDENLIVCESLVEKIKNTLNNLAQRNIKFISGE